MEGLPMANVVWHTKLRIYLDLNREDLDHPDKPDLWDVVYRTQQYYAARDIPVSERELQCGGVCRDAGIEAWMYLRLRANGRREAVHEHAEDEDRHTGPMSDEHKAYQERILRAAAEGGFSGDSEVRTRSGRGWIQTDALVEGTGGRRIGWEVQLSTAGTEGPRSVRARASKAAKNGITPAWHTDRLDYAERHDTQWTRSNRLPAKVIAKNGDLRVISGYRALDFWHCDERALYMCPYGVRRCGKEHVTPRPRDIFFDDLVRATAAGEIVPVEHRPLTKIHRFWVTHEDRRRLEELDPNAELPPARQPSTPPTRHSPRPPTCRPDVPVGENPAPSSPIPVQPTTPAAETIPKLEAHPPLVPTPHPPGRDQSDLPAELVALQQAADEEGRKMSGVGDQDRDTQRAAWRQAAAAAQAAVTAYARFKRLNRYEVEQSLRQATRHIAAHEPTKQPTVP
ncbi:hypothetical protein SLNWT_0126 [Streptomyces albus]|uniref:Uncharacterized protein n=1 Tax=Streptomyces albus (strain ATCC 21838 / DSM 41398 / FERM P-419 / JCM 4703 / NBRC 107858) TaxID=1081613 RepID=A0A0B5EQR7_STRA4|nr:hypothetical protein SLNWT_0126 [Streptomyces albus]AOU74821.1 hypothetical protein SLNHY_0130 [Streptomyces albus]